MTNNPRQKFWEHRRNEKGEIERVGNRYYKLRDVVRASTAAPYYFAPQRMEIFQHAQGDRLEGLFVDGGVSPYNNPAWQLFMLAEFTLMASIGPSVRTISSLFPLARAGSAQLFQWKKPLACGLRCSPWMR